MLSHLATIAGPFHGPRPMPLCLRSPRTPDTRPPPPTQPGTVVVAVRADSAPQHPCEEQNPQNDGDRDQRIEPGSGVTHRMWGTTVSRALARECVETPGGCRNQQRDDKQAPDRQARRPSPVSSLQRKPPVPTWRPWIRAHRPILCLEQSTVGEIKKTNLATLEDEGSA